MARWRGVEEEEGAGEGADMAEMVEIFFFVVEENRPWNYYAKKVLYLNYFNKALFKYQKNL